MPHSQRTAAKSFTFDSSSGELVGASDISDTSPACVYGKSPLIDTGSTTACQHTEMCMLCEETGAGACL
jgi:hypothetical protein